MAGSKGAGSKPAPAKASPRDGGTYALMLRVERYESLAEDMEELDVVSLGDVRRIIAELHEQLDAEGDLGQ